MAAPKSGGSAETYGRSQILYDLRRVQLIQYGANMCRRPVVHNVQDTIRFAVLYGHALWIKERTAHLLPLCTESLCKEVSHLVETYMDDCTVMSMEFNMHCANVEDSLNLMERGKTKVNPWKSHFFQQGVKSLGHYVDTAEYQC